MPDERPKFEAPYNTARRIVCEEWHKAVEEYRLTPGSVTEAVVSRIINRLDETAWPTDGLSTTRGPGEMAEDILNAARSR